MGLQVDLCALLKLTLDGIDVIVHRKSSHLDTSTTRYVTQLSRCLYARMSTLCMPE